MPHVVNAKPSNNIPKNKNQSIAYFKKIWSEFLANKKTNIRPPASGVVPFMDYSDFEFSYKEFLLNPLKQDGTATSDEVSLYGKRSPGFSYPIKPESPIKLKNGNIAVFDSGNFAQFNGEESYSRAVEYAVTKDDDGIGGTVKEVWSYTPEPKIISSGGGHIHEYENGNRFITFGAYKGENQEALIVEIEPRENKPVFKCTLQLSPQSFLQKATKVDISKL